MKLEYKWKTKVGYGSGEYLTIHGIVVGGYSWHITKDRKDWVGHVSLPGIKKDFIIEGDTQEEIRSKVERTVHLWFHKILAKPVEKKNA
jgi:alpha-acetolactate decarboxylase